MRYFQRKDGTILLRDCSIGIRSKRKRYAIAAGAAMLLASGALFAFKPSHKCGGGILAVQVPEDVQAIAGGISVPVEVPQEIRGEPPMMKAPHAKPSKSVRK